MKKSSQSLHLAENTMLSGTSVYLRIPRPDELSFIQDLWADPETMKPVGGPVILSDTHAEQWFNRMVRPGSPSNCYCLIFTRDDIPAGEISFHNWDAATRSADLNVKVSDAFRGNGYGKDALQTFLSFFFNTVGGRVMRDDVAPGNTGGQHLLISLGFERDTRITAVCRLELTAERYAAIKRCI
jgi:RimJ/RimL family protein N-acetyltransferase